MLFQRDVLDQLAALRTNPAAAQNDVSTLTKQRIEQAASVSAGPVTVADFPGNLVRSDPDASDIPGRRPRWEGRFQMKINKSSP